MSQLRHRASPSGDLPRFSGRGFASGRAGGAGAVGGANVRRALLVALMATVSARGAAAQAFNYPSLQLPSVSTRDYTAALSGGPGTTALFQWREGWTATRHVEVDAGVIDRKGSQRLMVFAGGSVGQDVARATKDQPLDLLLTVGGGVAVGSGETLVRIPVGLSVGHRFALDQGMTVTPYVHPRVSLDACGSCGVAERRRSEVSLNFDLGVSLQVSPQFAIRAAGAFSGSDLLGTEDSFAVGFAWTPAAMAKQQ